VIGDNRRSGARFGDRIGVAMHDLPLMYPPASNGFLTPQLEDNPDAA
jgi:hypothetical protein